MDILNSKYLSADELRQIALNTSATAIIPFCQTNKATMKVCNNPNFWIDYIGDNQRRYNKLILQIAKNGELQLFRKLWGNKNLKIVIEPRLLIPAFEKAYLNGHELMADYLIYLHKQFKVDADEYELKDIVKGFGYNDYDIWRNIDNKFWATHNKLDGHILLSINNYKLNLLLKMSISEDDLEYTMDIIKLYKRPSDIIKRYSKLNLGQRVRIALGNAKSLKFVNKVLLEVSGYKYDRLSNGEKISLLDSALLVGNFKLAQEIIDKYGGVFAEYYSGAPYILTALRSKSPYSLNFIKNNGVSIKNLTDYNDTVGTRKLVYKLLNIIDEDNIFNFLSNQITTFSNHPYEYVNLIRDYFGCITKRERNSIVDFMLEGGAHYMAKVFLEEVAICDEREINNT